MPVGKFYLEVYRHRLTLGEDEVWVDLNNLEIHPDIARQLADLGIVEIHRDRIPLRQVGRIKKLMRLRENLGVNIAGATIILDLLDRIEIMQGEIEALKRR